MRITNSVYFFYPPIVYMRINNYPHIHYMRIKNYPHIHYVRIKPTKFSYSSLPIFLLLPLPIFLLLIRAPILLLLPRPSCISLPWSCPPVLLTWLHRYLRSMTSSQLLLPSLTSPLFPNAGINDVVEAGPGEVKYVVPGSATAAAIPASCSLRCT